MKICGGHVHVPVPLSSACNGTRSTATVQCISSSVTGVAASRSEHEQSQRCREQGSRIQELHLSTTCLLKNCVQYKLEVEN